MHRKVRHVVLLIITLLVVVNLLQVYWLYSNYREQKQQYQQLLTNCLNEAAIRYQMYTTLNSGRNDSTFYIISRTENSTFQLKRDSISTQLVFTSPEVSIDSVDGSFGHTQLALLQHKSRFEKIIFDSLLKEILTKKDIRASFVSDTIHLAPLKRHAFPSSKRYPVPSMVPANRSHEEYPVRTALVLLHPYSRLAVMASFRPFPAFVLKKMLWIILPSLAILIAVNVTLVYIWKTITLQKQLNDIKNDFINNMTHELRTPIAISAGALDSILNHHGLDNKQQVASYLKTSRNELLHLDRLVEKILLSALEDRSDLKLYLQQVNLGTLVQTICHNYTLASTKKLYFHFEVASETLLQADKDHLAQALNNVIDNAVKYSDAPVHIQIRCDIKDGFAVLSIKDNGTGIPPIYHQEIFTSFFRVPRDDRNDTKGYGLGLSYVKKVIEKHKGHIELESEPGKGSLFKLFIPFNGNTNEKNTSY